MIWVKQGQSKGFGHMKFIDVSLQPPCTPFLLPTTSIPALHERLEPVPMALMRPSGEADVCFFISSSESLATTTPTHPKQAPCQLRTTGTGGYFRLPSPCKSQNKEQWLLWRKQMWVSNPRGGGGGQRPAGRMSIPTANSRVAHRWQL